MKRGFLIVYAGDGTSETTPALGQVFRALGRGFRVCVIQFSGESLQWGELAVADRFRDLLDIRVPIRAIAGKAEDTERDIEVAREAWETAKEAINSGSYDLVVLDEITPVIKHKSIDEAEVLRFLRDRPANVHLVATGRNASRSLIEAADLVTEVREINPHRSEE